MIAIIDRLCRWGGALAALSLLMLFTIRLLEIVLRAVVSFSSPLIGEYSEYLLMAVFLLGAGHVMRQGGHIRVSLLADKIPARWGGACARLAAWASFGVGLFAALSVSWFALGTLWRGTLSYHASATPLWIPQSVAALGFWLLCLALLANALERRPSSAGRTDAARGALPPADRAPNR